LPLVDAIASTARIAVDVQVNLRECCCDRFSAGCHFRVKRLHIDQVFGDA